MGRKSRTYTGGGRRTTPSRTPSELAVLITGASSGIGSDLAREFAAQGLPLVLHGRDSGRLAEIAEEIRNRWGVFVHTVSIDLSRPGSAQELFRSVGRVGVQVDILVNNAGVGLHGKFSGTDPDGESRMLHLNVTSLVELTKLFLPGMVGRRRGRILNVASTAAFQPGPLMAGYYATKAYVLSLSVALAEELRGSGIAVAVLCPGPTPTRFQERAGLKDVLVQRLAFKTSAEVARIGVRGLLDGKTVIVAGFLNKVGTVLVRLFPLRVSAWVVGKLQEHRT